MEIKIDADSRLLCICPACDKEWEQAGTYPLSCQVPASRTFDLATTGKKPDLDRLSILMELFREMTPAERLRTFAYLEAVHKRDL